MSDPVRESLLDHAEEHKAMEDAEKAEQDNTEAKANAEANVKEFLEDLRTEESHRRTKNKEAFMQQLQCSIVRNTRRTETTATTTI